MRPISWRSQVRFLPPQRFILAAASGLITAKTREVCGPRAIKLWASACRRAPLGVIRALTRL